MPACPTFPSRPVSFLLLTPPDSGFYQFLAESHRIVEFQPHILDLIEADLNRHALEKKLVREADRRFLEGQTDDLPTLKVELRQVDPLTIRLESGRPRIEPYVVYVFTMLRGFCGGSKDQQARLLLEESLTLQWWLDNLGIRLPAPSTLHENLNALSNETLQFIHRAQLLSSLSEGLDDFRSLFIDSTAIQANSQRPTDSGLIDKLVERICRLGGKFDRFGLPNFNASGLEQLTDDVHGLHRAIGFLTGKPKNKGKIKKRYYQLMRRACRACKRFGKEVAKIKQVFETKQDLLPSQRLSIESLFEMISEDIEAIGRIAKTCQRRIFEDKQSPSGQKIISTSDSDAAFIVKGGWDSVVGYRPQLGKSANGFVSALVLPRGNAADSGQLINVVLEHWNQCQVMPNLVSTDDGYCSKKDREDLLQCNMEVVSIGGAKGKKITPDQQWNSPDYRRARDNRSAVESLMFTLKDGYDFGQLSRREIINVRAELMEKILAYNINQRIRIRRRKALAQQSALAA